MFKIFNLALVLLELRKQKQKPHYAFIIWHCVAGSVEFNYAEIEQWRSHSIHILWIGDPLTGLTPTLLYACPKPEPEFLMSYVLVFVQLVKERSDCSFC